MTLKEALESEATMLGRSVSPVDHAVLVDNVFVLVYDTVESNQGQRRVAVFVDKWRRSSTIVKVWQGS